MAFSDPLPSLPVNACAILILRHPDASFLTPPHYSMYLSWGGEQMVVSWKKQPKKKREAGLKACNNMAFSDPLRSLPVNACAILILRLPDASFPSLPKYQGPPYKFEHLRVNFFKCPERSRALRA